MTSIVRSDIQVPVIITRGRKGCDIYIPDFNMTVHGVDYVDTIAAAIMCCSAVYYYNLERNVHWQLNTQYAQAEALARKKKHGSFATLICLTA